MFVLKRNIDSYVPKLLNSNMPVSKMILCITKRFTKEEIVDFFRDHNGNKLAMLSDDELFVKGSLFSFNEWLGTVINLMLVSLSYDLYCNEFSKLSERHDKLTKLENMQRNKLVSSQQYLFLKELIHCNIILKP